MNVVVREQLSESNRSSHLSPCSPNNLPERVRSLHLLMERQRRCMFSAIMNHGKQLLLGVRRP